MPVIMDSYGVEKHFMKRNYVWEPKICLDCLTMDVGVDVKQH